MFFGLWLFIVASLLEFSSFSKKTWGVIDTGTRKPKF